MVDAGTSPSPRPDPDWSWVTRRISSTTYDNINDIGHQSLPDVAVVHSSVEMSSTPSTVLIISIIAAVVIIVIVVAVAAVCISRNRQPPTTNISLQVTNTNQSPPLQVTATGQPPPLQVTETSRPPPFATNTGGTVQTEVPLPGYEEKAAPIPVQPGPPAIPSAPPEEHVRSSWQIKILQLLSSHHQSDQDHWSSTVEIVIRNMNKIERPMTLTTLAKTLLTITKLAISFVDEPIIW